MKFFSFFLIAIIATFTSVAQKQKSLLWKISGKNLQYPSFIFGTFHLLCANDLKIPDTLKTIIHRSRQVFFEIKMDDPDMYRKAQNMIVMKDGHKLSDFTSNIEYDSISSIFQNKTKIPISLVTSYKPYLLVPLLYQSMLGCEPIAFELELQKIAKRDSTPIYGLETLEYQMLLFDSIPYQQQVRMLIKSLFGFEQAKTDLNKMIKMYKSKDIEQISKSTKEDEDFGTYENALITTRNHNWLPLILSASGRMPSFFAVGAGHLAGSNGVLNLLRLEGYTITPVIY